MKQHTQIFSVLYFFAVIFLSVYGSLQHPLFSHAAVFATSSPSYAVSTLSIYDAKIEPQNTRAIVVTFAFHNDVGAQTDVKYGLTLHSTQKGETAIIADQYISPETLSLSESQTVGRTLSYTAPTYIPSGIYTVVINAQTSAGIPLASAVAGKVTFAQPKTSDYVTITPSTCFLAQKLSNATYKPRIFISIHPAQDIHLTCNVESHLAKTQLLSASFETHAWSQFGPTLSTTHASSTSLKPGEKKQISFTLPTFTTSQTYAVAMNLKDALGVPVSNPIFFSYVVQGQSATILSVLLDKDHYSAGTTANATIDWIESTSTDSLAPSNPSIELKLSDGTGKACANVVTQQVNPDQLEMRQSIPITANCINPSLLVSIKDTNGALLVQRAFVVISSSVASTTTRSVPPWVFLAIAVGVLVFVAIGFLIRRKLYTHSI